MSKALFVLKIIGLMFLVCLLLTIACVFFTIGAAFMANGVETLFDIYHVHNVGGITYVF